MIISLTTLIVGATLVAAIAVFFWPQIMHFCKNYFIPWIRNHISDSAADLLADVIHYTVDNVACFGRQKAKEVWKWLKQTIASMVSTFTETPDGRYVEKREDIFHDAQEDNYKMVVHQRVLNYEDLPADVRRELNRKNLTSFKCDNEKQILMEKYQEKAQKKGDLTATDILELTC